MRSGDRILLRTLHENAMSIFHLTPSQVRDELDELPTTHTRAQIFALVDRLQKDMQDDPPDLTFTNRVHRHADKHKELFFSYPMLFRSVCKGTFRPVVVDILMDAREAMENGRKSKKEALEDVIRKSVDEVKEARRKNIA